MLALRVGVAWFFYKSALNKVTQVLPWPEVSDLTYKLFESFYQVPLLDPRLAALIGTFVPIILDKRGIDPAIATGPFITTSNDIFGIFLFFYLAKLILGF